MSKEQPGYESQRRFDQRLVKLGLFDFGGFGPRSDEFFKVLEAAGLCLKGRKIVKV